MSNQKNDFMAMSSIYEKLADEFILDAYFFYNAWFFTRDIKWAGSEEKVDVSDWLNSPPDLSPVSKFWERMHKKHIEEVDWRQFLVDDNPSLPIYREEPAKELAFYLLGVYIDDPKVVYDFQNDDSGYLKIVSLHYFLLAVLCKSYLEVLEFLERNVIAGEPALWFESFRNDISRGHQVFGAALSKSRETRVRLEKYSRQVQAGRDGGNSRSRKYSMHRIKEQFEADDIWSRKPEMSISGVARIIAKRTGGKFETIRRHIRKK